VLIAIVTIRCTHSWPSRFSNNLASSSKV